MRYAEYVIAIESGWYDNEIKEYREPRVSHLVRVDNGGGDEVIKELVREPHGFRRKFINVCPSNLGDKNDSVHCRGTYLGLANGGFSLGSLEVVETFCAMLPVLLAGDGERGVWRRYMEERRHERDAADSAFDYLAEEQAYAAMNGIDWSTPEYKAAHAKWVPMHREKMRIKRLTEQLELLEDIDVENRCWDETNTSNAAVYFTAEDTRADRERMRAEGCKPEDV